MATPPLPALAMAGPPLGGSASMLTCLDDLTTGGAVKTCGGDIATWTGFGRGSGAGLVACVRDSPCRNAVSDIPGPECLSG